MLFSEERTLLCGALLVGLRYFNYLILVNSDSMRSKKFLNTCFQFANLLSISNLLSKSAFRASSFILLKELTNTRLFKEDGTSTT